MPAKWKRERGHVNSHGFKVVIPARYASTRLPGKVLRTIAGKPMLQHVWSRACTSGAESVVVATDDSRVAEAAGTFGADVCLTGSGHVSGTDRVNEVAALSGWTDDEVVVNLQGDEPLMPPALIRQMGDMLLNCDADIATACVPISDPGEWRDPNVVKVVRDVRGRALYFSRAPIPWDRTRGQYGLPAARASRHIGIYAYRVGVLRRLATTPPCPLELCESLEQLRAQWLGMSLAVGDACEVPGRGVDTEDDLRAVESILNGEEGAR